MSKKTTYTGRLLWTRLEADYSREHKSGFQVAHVTGLSAEDVAIIQEIVTPWDFVTPLRSVALPDERIAVARFAKLKNDTSSLYRKLIDKCYRGGVYVADVRVYDAPRWQHVDSLDSVLRETTQR